MNGEHVRRNPNRTEPLSDGGTAGEEGERVSWPLPFPSHLTQFLVTVFHLLRLVRVK